MTRNSIHSLGFMCALIALYFIAGCQGGNPDAEWRSNSTEIYRSDSDWDIETGRGHHHHHKGFHLLGLFYDFVITPIANAVLAIITLGGGGIASVILNLVLAFIRHLFGFLWKAFKLWWTVHNTGWGWGNSFDLHHHHGWRSDVGHDSVLI